jgi:hypothetical protein
VPRIFDNIDLNLLPALRATPSSFARAFLVSGSLSMTSIFAMAISF